MLRKIIANTITLFLYVFVLPFKIKEIRNNNGIISIYSHYPPHNKFENLIKWFLKRNYEFISTDELIQIIKNNTKTKNKIWLTFDDGLKTNVDDILPVLKKYHIPATFFVSPNLHKQSGRFMTKNEIKLINACNYATIGNHTFNHLNVLSLDIKDVSKEILKCNSELSEFSNYNNHIFSYPFGKYSNDVVELLKNENFVLAATTQPTYITNNADLFFVPRCGFGEDLSLIENICHCFGIWQPVVKRIKSVKK